MMLIKEKLNSVKLELVKSDNATLLQFFWGQNHLYLNDSQYNEHKMRSYFLCQFFTISDIIDYTKFCKLPKDLIDYY